MAKAKKVAVMLPMRSVHEIRVLEGVADYVSEHTNWTLDINTHGSNYSLQTLAGWTGHGVLAQLSTHAQLRAARKLKASVVNMAGTLHNTGFPQVMVDQEAVGRLAAKDLLRRGFRRLAYYGQRGKWFSQQRKRGFIEEVKLAGGTCAVFDSPSNSNSKSPWYLWTERLKQWITTLDPPFGVMAVHDYWARMVLDACQQLRLRVPHDVALIGVDNDEIVCNFCEVPISSVARNARQEGYEAASLLDRLMSGKRPPKSDILISPEGIVHRLSTDMEAIENPHVAAAVHLIRERLGESFGVELLDKHIPVSRRYLYYHFKKCLNCTPYQYINQARVERAMQLLSSPKKLQLQQVAQACGFSETRRLRVVFEQITGVSPAEFRRVHSSDVAAAASSQQ